MFAVVVDMRDEILIETIKNLNPLVSSGHGLNKNSTELIWNLPSKHVYVTIWDYMILNIRVCVYAVGTALWGQPERWKLLRCPNQNVTFEFTTISASEKKLKTNNRTETRLIHWINNPYK